MPRASPALVAGRGHPGQRRKIRTPCERVFGQPTGPVGFGSCSPARRFSGERGNPAQARPPISRRAWRRRSRWTKIETADQAAARPSSTPCADRERLCGLPPSAGRVGIGADLDPLAVIITRTACHPAHGPTNLGERAEALARDARAGSATKLPDVDRAGPRRRASSSSYWFAPEQAEDLSRIARVLIDRPRTDDPLRVAFSRMIVTKERGRLARPRHVSQPAAQSRG